MLRRLAFLLFFLAIPALAAEPRPLFDGKTLTGWKAEGAKTYKDGTKTLPVWSAEDGMIRCKATGGFGFLRYEKEKFSDFVLHVEYRFHKMGKKVGNSGIGIRTVEFDPKRSTATRPSYAAYEIQLLDDAGKKPDRHSTGSLYRYVAPSVSANKPSPEWNSIDIECKGPQIRITLNGKKIIDVDQTKISQIKNKPLTGFVSLQVHGSPIDFRNITIRPLSR
jgi:hypothetical protein